MLEIVKKAALWGFVGVPVFIVSSALSTGIIGSLTKLVPNVNIKIEK